MLRFARGITGAFQKPPQRGFHSSPASAKSSSHFNNSNNHPFSSPMRAKPLSVEEVLERFHPRDFYSRPPFAGEIGWPSPEFGLDNPFVRYQRLPEHNEWTERMLQNEFYWKRKQIFDKHPPYTTNRLYASSTNPQWITYTGTEQLSFAPVTSAVGASPAHLTFKRPFSSLLNLSPQTPPSSSSSSASSSTHTQQSQKQSLQPQESVNTDMYNDDNIIHPPMFLHESPPSPPAEEMERNNEEKISNEDRESDDFAPEADARNFADEPEADLPAGQDPRMWHTEGPRQSPGFRIRSLIKHLFDASEHEEEGSTSRSSSSSIHGRREEGRKLKDMNIMTNEDDITKS